MDLPLWSQVQFFNSDIPIKYTKVMVRRFLASLDTNIEALCEIHLAIPQILVTENIFMFRRLSAYTKAFDTPLF